jgi:N-acetylneuraminate synthase/N,N'-diacetyllegionaminate synthase
LKWEVKIGNKKVGKEHPTYIIAEIGSNHDGNIKIAKKMIDKAADAGADAVKFQTFKAEKLFSKKTPKISTYKKKPFELIKSLEMPREWHKELYDYTVNKNLHFLSSPFDYEAVDELYDVGVPAFKIGSCEITDLELLGYIAKKNKPIILSTGMATLGDIEDALDIIRSKGNDNILLLHCNTLYPAPPRIVNLNAIQTLSTAFKIPVGFSDHTMGIHISIAAVAKGAQIIEKHFTIKRRPEPDHFFSIEPEELKIMIKNIREIEVAFGSGRKERSKEEDENYEKGRRSIIAAREIPEGKIIEREDLIVKRPGMGIHPKYINIVVGRRAKKKIYYDDWITWDKI